MFRKSMPLLRAGCGCASPAPSATDSEGLLDTFKSTLGETLGRLLAARCTKREAKLVIHAQESTFVPALDGR